MSTKFSFGRSFDIPALKAIFAEQRRIDLPGFLSPDDAGKAQAHLRGRPDWQLVVNAGDAVYEIPRSGVDSFTEAQRREFDDRIATAARSDFQYRYESIRVADDPAQRDHTSLDDLVTFMSSDPVLSLLREITGIDNIDFADGQATSYSSGHFLTRHDDDVPIKHRRAAYVLGLTPGWRADWGGLLMFHRADGNISEAFVPAMGALRVFDIPTPHSVSYVTPFAPEPRLSVTGWLRSGNPSERQSVR